MSKADFRTHPHPDYRFWLYDPDIDGLAYYRTAEERDAAAPGLIEGYQDDNEWCEEVELIAAGEVTHIAGVPNKAMRPSEDEIDDEGCDSEGTEWPEGMKWRGDYQLVPVGVQK